MRWRAVGTRRGKTGGSTIVSDSRTLGPARGMLLLMTTFAKKTVAFGYADNLQAQFVLLQ